ncbi:ABC transporter ATP-binding protein [Pararobbsia silviterrae]|uniref:ABC transporter ATP-binding protein n=1 Tax=Pararobbsia silviterrae TaxID=1792498 RepID=A0A494Y1C0_9BURK|nr:ABC transporter ATP-binding protein [Pararobbsia silviterrae]RKP56564.1 ABC transporter ATP-binding protein [Pararobbsia silviterrae]
MSLLQVSNLHAHYDKSHVLKSVNLRVEAGEIVSLLGRNGSGRSTTLKALAGLVPPTTGSIRLGGRELAHEAPHRIARAGIGYVPEERLVFPDLSVEENLQIGMQPATRGAHVWDIEQMYAYFPRLRERRKTHAGNLSGGEQQMLTLCRSLLGHPSVLLVDEPTEGLAPKIVTHLVDVIEDINRRGVTVLLVEQKMTIALRVAHRCLIMGRGQIVFEGTPAQLRANAEVRRNWLEVGG